jgi:thiamine biosynthesis lipoprotein ApbE
MVMDSRRGLVLIESLPGCEAYLITKDLQSRQSSGWL